MTPGDRTPLRGDRLLLRPAAEADISSLLAIVREPAVARWWGDYNHARLQVELLEEAESFAIELDGSLIGVVMVSEENDPQYRHAGLDITLASAHHGRQLGREALRVVIDHLVGDRGHHRLTIDPARDNEIAIRCYSAAGFRPVGVMHRYERTPDGYWRDGLLMELVVAD